MRDDAGKAYVRMEFVAPSLDQIRNASAIDDRSPPIRATIPLPGCEAEAKEGACPLDRFVELANAKLDKSAVAPTAFH